MEDLSNLSRFLDAQAGIYVRVLDELHAGYKHSHWMWFIFPQFDGLGMSAASRHFAIKSPEEARAYLHHPVLGVRLVECTSIVNGIEGRSIHDIFGTPDDKKFFSSMTLFDLIAEPERTEFRFALEKFFRGERDERTLELVRLVTEER